VGLIAFVIIVRDELQEMKVEANIDCVSVSEAEGYCCC